jgi:hypothetical protein
VNRESQGACRPSAVTASPGLRPEPQERLGLRRVPHGAGVMTLARQIGDKLERDPIPEIEAATVYPVRCGRRDIWPVDVWAEMEAIRNGEVQ